ncbi:MAG: host-nuclease inhibitor Gam family protein [Ezakiella sp.]|nr:host-nuclease inhibitor Gam family protein [Ezakiella sp.]
MEDLEIYEATSGDPTFYDRDEIAERKAWSITDDGGAVWATRRLKELEEEKRRKEKMADEEISRLELWKDKELKKIENEKEFFTNHLSSYLMRLRENNPKAKIETPYAKVSMRKNPDKWIYKDDVINSLKRTDMSAFIRVKEEVDKVGLKKAVTVKDGKAYTAYGEEIEGVEIIDGGESLSIKIEN